VIAGDTSLQLHEAEEVLGRLPVQFDHYEMFPDDGLGVHGLPYYADRLVEDAYLFECGHTVMPASHYEALDSAYTDGCVVFSAYHAHPLNLRFPIALSDDGRLVGVGASGVRGLTVAHPFIVDRRYGRDLPSFGFNIDRVTEGLAAAKRLNVIFTSWPPDRCR
jgi:hypothetical protein